MLKYIDEFRDKKLIDKLAANIITLPPGEQVSIMEVCGSHTLTIMKYGIRQLIPEYIKLISGPGCPVCVTSQNYIDTLIKLSKLKNTIITSFGDMLRVPGTHSSLLKEKSAGNDIRICLSPANAVNIALKNPGKQVIFAGIGFETTAPVIAASILSAKQLNLKNFSILCSVKTMPEVMETLLQDNDINIDAFICPGHVTAVTGTEIYKTAAEKYKKPCVICGFEPSDLLMTIYLILKQLNNKESKIENQYIRTVKQEGNTTAKKIINQVFEKCDAYWRGMGRIKNSGFNIKKKFSMFNAYEKFNISEDKNTANTDCICGDILKSIKKPFDCKLFSSECTPQNPIGACMVSTEGTCNIFYKYGSRENIHE